MSRPIRLIVASIIALVGGYLLHEAADTAASTSSVVGLSLGGLVLWAVTAVWLYRHYQRGIDQFSNDEVPIREWGFARFLSRSVEAAPLWLGVRIFLAWEWLEAGSHKFQDPKWLSTGEALKAYWERAALVPAAPARPAIAFPAYRAFIQFMLDHQWYPWFAKLITFGELLVGLGLLVGALVGIAAFFGLVMNFSFMFAGATSSNPLLIIFEAMLAFWAWRNAGWIGLDRFLLPRLGTPWDLGRHAPADGQRLAEVVPQPRL